MGVREAEVEIRSVLPDDYLGLLRLQEANFIGNLSAKERQSGYLSVRFTSEQFADMAADPGVIVGVSGGLVVAFVCGSLSTLAPQPPILDRMIQEFERIDFQGRRVASYRWFLYGPVCIDRLHRGRGLLRRLYSALTEQVAGKYDIGVAFVADENPHSLRAHSDGLGMERIGHFELNGRGYHILAFSVAAHGDREGG